jgi:hypothetical protein
VRLGRPANDNARQPSVLVRLFVVALAAALALLAAANWGLDLVLRDHFRSISSIL